MREVKSSMSKDSVKCYRFHWFLVGIAGGLIFSLIIFNVTGFVYEPVFNSENIESVPTALETLHAWNQNAILSNFTENDKVSDYCYINSDGEYHSIWSGCQNYFIQLHASMQGSHDDYDCSYYQELYNSGGYGVIDKCEDTKKFKKPDWCSDASWNGTHCIRWEFEFSDDDAVFVDDRLQQLYEYCEFMDGEYLNLPSNCTLLSGEVVVIYYD